ncbi:MAG: hypothetical protein ACLGI2_11305 [Acidimicrobiia bacterium]
MTLSREDAAAYAQIVAQVPDPEVRRDRAVLLLLATAVLVVLAAVTTLAGWGWPPLVGFCGTFVPGIGSPE